IATIGHFRHFPQDFPRSLHLQSGGCNVVGSRSRSFVMRILTIVLGCHLLYSTAAAAHPAVRTPPAACAALTQLQVAGVALAISKAEWLAAGAPLPGGRGGAAPQPS